MEIILAIVVASAVIFFGALISMGNERQKEAIDGLREQVVFWAMQDLKVKREKLVQDVSVDDPQAWFNKLATKVCGYPLHLQGFEVFAELRTLVCCQDEIDGKIIFSSYSPAEIHALERSRRSRLSQFADRNPLFSMPRNTKIFKVSVLNGGILFDLELSLAWQGLTDSTVEPIDQLWIYVCAKNLDG